MNVHATLNRDQYIRVSLWRHFSRRLFFFYAATAAFVTAYAIIFEAYIFLLVGWIPFSLYILFGMVDVFRSSRQDNQPALQPTQYKFEKSNISVKMGGETSQLAWDDLKNWRLIADCYVLVLVNGAVLAIPKRDVPLQRVKKFEDLLNEQIKG